MDRAAKDRGGAVVRGGKKGGQLLDRGGEGGEGLKVGQEEVDRAEHGGRREWSG